MFANLNYHDKWTTDLPVLQLQSTRQLKDSYVSSYDALLGHHEDEADEDGRAQHADGTNERVSSLCLLPAQASGGRPDDHA